MTTATAAPAPSTNVPVDVWGILNNSSDVDFVAVWMDAEGVTYVQGYISDNVRSFPGQVLTHLTEYGIPLPWGTWTIYPKGGGIRIID